MRRLSTLALSACLCLALAGMAQASIVTGDPLPANPLWTPNSTNALNYASQAPGRVGQLGPHVLLNSVGPGSVTLDFFAGQNGGQARFEIRIDGIATGATPHFVVPSDTIHGGYNVHSSLPGPSNPNGYPQSRQETIVASQYVDVRLALGGERDYDFDWVRFEVGPAVVPEPGTIAIWSGIAVMAGAVYARRRRNA